MHPDLANLEQFYVRTRADVASGRLSGSEGIARVQSNTVTDASGRVWMVDPMSDPQRATFKVIAPGQQPVTADPSQYVPGGGFDQGMGMPGQIPAAMGGFPAQSMPMEAPEKKGRFRRDKSAGALKASSSLRGKITSLPKWAYLAGALAVVLLLVAFRMLSGGAPAPSPAPTSVPASSAPGTSTADSLPGGSTIPGQSTVPGVIPTTVPVTTPPVSPSELSAATVTDLIASLESLEISRAQTAVSEPLDQVAYANFIAKNQSGQRLSIVGDPVAFAGAPAASVTLQRTTSDGTQIGTETVVLVQDPASLAWRFRSLPTL